MLHCPILLNYIRGSIRRFKHKHRFHRHMKVGHHSHFFMLITNVTDVVDRLNEISRRPKLFICINDDLTYSGKFRRENQQIFNLLEDFYMTMFPKQSQYEMPGTARNTFQYIEDYREALETHRKNICLACFFIGNFWILYLFHYIVWL